MNLNRMKWNIERKGKKYIYIYRLDSIEERVSSQVFESSALSSEILIYLRGNKPWSDHLLFNRRAGFRSDRKKSRHGEKTGSGGRGREKRKRENVIRSRNKIKRIYTLERGISSGWTRGWVELPEHELPPAGNGPITCPPFLRTWPVILRSTFTNDPAYRSGSLRGR